MKSVYLLFTSAFIAIQTFAQDNIRNLGSPWEKSIQFGLNFNQATFSKAWKGGGSNSISIGFLCNAKANYTTGDDTWKNTLQMQYGFVNGQGVSGLRKSTDRLFFDSK